MDSEGWSQEAIRDFLFKNGYPSRYTRKRWNLKTEHHHGKYTGYPVIIKTMRDAIEFVISDSSCKSQ